MNIAPTLFNQGYPGRITYRSRLSEFILYHTSSLSGCTLEFPKELKPCPQRTELSPRDSDSFGIQ